VYPVLIVHPVAQQQMIDYLDIIGIIVFIVHLVDLDYLDFTVIDYPDSLEDQSYLRHYLAYLDYPVITDIIGSLVVMEAQYSRSQLFLLLKYLLIMEHH
jgi:hypothetical protein